MKIATWNVNSLRVRLPQVLDWLERNPVDVLGLQETKLTDDDFPVDTLREAGFTAKFSGQKTYNGVALLIRDGLPVSDVLRDLPDLGDPQRRVMVATVGDIRVANLYVPNGEALTSAKFEYKLDWLDTLRIYLEGELRTHGQIAVMGDFNIAPDDRDIHDPEAWEGRIHCSPQEREALQRLIDLGFTDTFRMFDQPAKSFSWWDYRAGGFRRNLGLRIDLILASPELAARCVACKIDPIPRGWKRPSDHTPVVATF